MTIGTCLISMVRFFSPFRIGVSLLISLIKCLGFPPLNKPRIYPKWGAHPQVNPTFIPSVGYVVKVSHLEFAYNGEREPNYWEAALNTLRCI